MNTVGKLYQEVENSGLNSTTSDNKSLLIYDNVLDAVYAYIAENTDSKTLVMSSAGSRARQAQILNLIQQYIEQNKPAVARPDNDAQFSLSDLQQTLVDDITKYGAITSAYIDPTVSEIQINDYQTIWVEKAGDLQLMRDEVTGERVMFKNQEECFKVINKLLRNSKAHFNRTSTIAKGRTIEGFRVAAVHMEATAGEKGRYQDRPVSPSCVIRKFPENNWTVRDLVNFKSVTAEMANFLSIVPKSNVTILVVGATGSGKTILVQIELNNVPDPFRMYVVENPSELGVKKYDAKGRPVNNVVQYEALADASEEDRANFSRHTEIALMMQALRMTPHYFVFGEVRLDAEINQAMVAANTGHKFITTFHSGDDMGALRRVIRSVIAINPGLPINTVIEDVCTNVDFIYTQAKQWDKSRKVLHFTEVEGYDYKDGVATPKLRRIFEFKRERKQPGDKKVRGAHYQVNEFSPAMLDHMMGSVMDITEYDLITQPLEKDENGNCIPRIGNYDENLVLDMERVKDVGAYTAVKELEERYKQCGIEFPFDMSQYDTVPEDIPAHIPEPHGTIEESAGIHGIQDDFIAVGEGPNSSDILRASALLRVEDELMRRQGTAEPIDIDLDAMADVFAETAPGNNKLRETTYIVDPNDESDEEAEEL